MALLRPSELSKLPRDAIVLDLGDLASQGRQLCDAASSKAEEILTEAKRERERILRGARDEGYAKGMQEGQAAGQKQGYAAGEKTALEESRARLAALDGAWSSALKTFESQREALTSAARTEVLGLALQIAERVIHRAIACEPGVVVDQVAAAVAQVMRPTGIVLAAHPQDVELVRAAIPELSKTLAAMRQATLAGDEKLARGSCVVRSAGGGIVDASIGTQLDRIAEALVPGRTKGAEGAT